MADAVADSTNGSSIPSYFGEYEVLKTIGKGKFAVVYRAKKKGSEEVVALKRIAVDMMNDKAREKCLKEVRLLQSLDHPNIIRYMDSFIMENDLIIVYEWAAAGDLKRQLRKAQERSAGFEERVIWKYFSQICNAMQHMHEKRIMHRDLKPANIFLTLDGTIKVGDLGLSRELSEHTVQAHSKVGTPLYMSPEVLKGDGYDFKSDVWSLGCLLYELAMLKSPFKSEGLNLYSLFQKISNGDFQPLPDNYSEELRSLTYSMISTNSVDRPEISSVCEVAQQMRTLTADRSKQQRKAATAAAATASSSTGTSGGSSNDSEAEFTAEDAAVAKQQQQQQQQQKDSEKSPQGGGAVYPMSSAADSKRSQPAAADDDDRTDSAFDRVETKDGSGRHRSSSNESKDATPPRNSSSSSLLRQQQQQQQRAMDDPATASTPPRNRLAADIYSNKHFDYDTTASDANNTDRNHTTTAAAAVGRVNSSNSNSNNNWQSRGSRHMGVAELTNNGSAATGSEYSSREGRALQRMGSFQIELVDEGYDDTETTAAAPAATATTITTASSTYATAATAAAVDGEFVPFRRQRSNSNASSATSASVAARTNADNTSLLTRGRSRDTINTNELDDNDNNDNDEDDDATVGMGQQQQMQKDRASEYNSQYSKAPANANAAAAPHRGYYEPPLSNDRNISGTTSAATASAAVTSNGYKRPKSRQQQNNNSNSDKTNNQQLSRSTNISNNNSSNSANKQVNSKKFTEHFQDSSEAFALMEMLYSKLVVLGYPLEDPHVSSSDVSSDYRSRGRLLPIHFACDMQIFARVAGHQSGFQFQQFRRAVQVALWLCNNKLQQQQQQQQVAVATHVMQVDIEQDTPVTMAKQMLRAVALSGLPASPELSQITPTSLISGYGVNVCLLLLHLADAALLQSKHVNKPLIYAAATAAADFDAAAAEGEESDDEIADETNQQFSNKNNNGSSSRRTGNDGNSDDYDSSLQLSQSGILAQSILLGNADPLQWQQETERVAAKLVAQKQQQLKMNSTAEWTAHIELLKKFNNSQQQEHQQQQQPPQNVLVGDLSSLRRQLRESLEKIQRSELLLNANETCALPSLHYSTIQKELLIKESQSAAAQQSIEKLTTQFSELQDRHDELQEALQARSDDSSSSSSGGGNSVIVRLKDAIQTLKQQIRVMSMDISLLNHTLLQERIRNMQRTSKYRKNRSHLEDSVSMLDDI